MWRTLFFTIGFCVLLVGLQFIFVEEVYPRSGLKVPLPYVKADADGNMQPIAPEQWVPWALVTGGAIVCLYSFTIPRRFASK